VREPGERDASANVRQFIWQHATGKMAGRGQQVGRQRIGTVARALNVTPRRLIEYERAGLICPARDPRTNDRLYDAHDIALLRRIVNLIREKHFSLAALRELFARAPCWIVLDCQYRDSCAVPRKGLVRCYEQRAAGVRTPRQGDCHSCPVYRCSIGHNPIRRRGPENGHTRAVGGFRRSRSGLPQQK